MLSTLRRAVIGASVGLLALSTFITDASAQFFSNPSFETPAYSAQNWYLTPSQASSQWNFTGNSGIRYFASPDGSNGRQAAYVAAEGTPASLGRFSQSVNLAPGKYLVRYLAARGAGLDNGGPGTVQPLQVYFGTSDATLSPLGGSIYPRWRSPSVQPNARAISIYEESGFETWWTQPFEVLPGAGGNYTIAFGATNPAALETQDSVTYVDQVAVVQVKAAFSNGSFEQVDGNGAPVGWALGDSTLGQSGVIPGQDGDRSLQLNYFQYSGFLSQNVTVPAGTYSISAKLRKGGVGFGCTTTVSILGPDGLTVQTALPPPAHQDFASYTSDSFTLVGGVNAFRFITFCGGIQQTISMDALVLNSAGSAFANPSFEVPNAADSAAPGYRAPGYFNGEAGAFRSQPAGASWVFDPNNGVMKNPAPCCGSSVLYLWPYSTFGAQYAFLNSPVASDGMSQSVYFDPGWYVVVMPAASYYQPSRLTVKIDGNVVSNIPQLSDPDTGLTERMSAPFQITVAGSHEVRFEGGAIIDAPRILQVIYNLPPTIAITSPPIASGKTYALVQGPVASGVVVNATASDPDGLAPGSLLIQQNGVQVGSVSSTSPYSATLGALSSGSYTISALATDGKGLPGSTSITLKVNSPPQGGFSMSPSGNVSTLYATPAAVTVSPIPSDTDGSIALVEVLVDGAAQPACTKSAPPWACTLSLSGRASGYSVTARATDDDGGVTTYAASGITINASPTVSITAPTNGTVLSAPASFSFTASAADSDGSIANVQYFNGATLIGTATTAPYPFTWSSVPTGTYSITARATDDRGATIISAAITVISNTIPTISITGPATSTIITAPATFNITTNAADADDGVAKVEFFSGPTLIGTVLAAPYNFNWTGVVAGNYPAITARVTDTRGASATSAPITLIANAAPTVSMTAPSSGAIFSAPATINLTATAADSDGTVVKVEFFNGATLLSTSTSAPYAYSWTGVAAGTYTITAKATDNRGAITTSAPITVISNAVPTIAFTSPANGAVWTAPAVFLLAVNAADADDGIAKVEYFNGTTLIGTTGQTANPYSFNWVNIPVGIYPAITAKVTDTRGATATAGPITVISNAAPTVTLTAPASGATYAAPATINLAATAADSDGTIAKVEFFSGTSILLGTSTTSPYAFTWTPVSAGNFSISARATDNRGANVTSATALITVCGAPTVLLGSPTNGQVIQLATAVATTTVSLTATPSSAAGCNVGKVEYYSGTTVVATATAAPWSASWASVVGGTYAVKARAYLSGSTTVFSESAVATLYVNKPPVISLTTPSTTQAALTTPSTITLAATATDPDGGVQSVSFYASASVFNATTLIGTVVTGQAAANGQPAQTGSTYSYVWTPPTASYPVTAIATDVRANTAQSTTNSLAVCGVPTVTLATTAANPIVLPANSAPLTATVVQPNTDAKCGTITKVEFFRTGNATALNTDTVAPYAFTVTGLVAGTTSYTAKVTDSAARAGTSNTVTITVVANVPPTISITSPGTNTVVTTPASFTFVTNAADSDGTLTKVEFFNGAALIGTVTSAPWNFTWSGIPTGTYSITAKATDNQNTSTTSAAITVIANNAPTVTLTAPANGATFTPPASITLTATASDSDGTIQNVQFLNGATLLNTDTSAPYTFNWTNVAAGTYTITALATDNRGATASNVATVTVLTPNTPPVITSFVASTATVVAGTVASFNLSVSDDKAGVSATLRNAAGVTIGSCAPFAGTNTNCSWTPPAAPGIYTVRAVVVDSDGASAVASATVAVLATPSASTVDYGVTTSTVGTISGSFSVSDAGAANYAIPIKVPPGISGLEPGLAFSYSSQGGDGFLGTGWSLSGLSAISRCPKTYAQDAIKAGVNYDNVANDAYCLDGQRLVPLSSGDPGSTDIEYRTETDSFSKVMSLASNPTLPGPGGWTVYTKDGKELRFSKHTFVLIRGFNPPPTPTQLVPVSGKVWLLDEIVDRYGNRVIVEYDGTNKGTTLITVPATARVNPSATAAFPFVEFWPSKFSYYNNTFTSSAATDGLLGQVELTPECRDGSAIGLDSCAASELAYFDSGAGESRVSRRLKNVKVSAADTAGTLSTVRNYQLAYSLSPASSRPRLTTIRECAGDGSTTCFTATQMTWETASAAYAGTGFSVVDTAKTATDIKRTKVTDINGDGRSDLLTYDRSIAVASPGAGKLPTASIWRQCLANGTGFDCSEIAVVGEEPPGGTTDRFWVTDTDGDGYADLSMVRSRNNFTQRFITTCRGSASGLSTTGGTITSGGAQIPIASCQDYQILNPSNSPACGGAESLCDDAAAVQFADIDGDGRAEILIVASTAANPMVLKTCFLESGQYVCRTNSTFGTPQYNDYWRFSNEDMLVGDFNGDGKTDVMRRNDGSINGWRTFLSTFDKPTSASATGDYVAGRTYVPAISGAVDKYTVLDLNGDGLADIAGQATGTAWKVCLAQGDGSFQFTDPSMTYDPGAVVPAVGAWVNSVGACYTTDGTGTVNGTTCQNVDLAPRCRTWSGLNRENNKIIWGDFNGDGRSDMASFINNTTLQVCLSKGNGFAPCTNWTLPAGFVGPSANDKVVDKIVTGDFNGDGRTDIALIIGGTIRVLFAGTAASANPTDVVTKIVNGLGAYTEVTYAPLTDDTVYARSAVALAAQEIEIQSPLYVVKQTRSDSGLAATATALQTDFTYQGMIGTKNGRGMLGFEKRSIVEQFPSPHTTTIEYNNRESGWQRAGRVSRVSKVVSGVVVSDVSSTWAFRDASTVTGCTTLPTGKIWQVFQTVGTETMRELDGNPMPTRSSLMPIAQIDCWGNVKSMTVGSSDGFSKVTTNTYKTADTTKWLVGLLATSNVAHTGPTGFTAVTRSSSFTYDTNTGYLSSETIEPTDTGSLYRKTDYTYDGYGNQASATVSFRENGLLKYRKTATDYGFNGRYPSQITRADTANGITPAERQTEYFDSYDLRFGSLVKRRADNGTYALMRYDDFGRKALETGYGPSGDRLGETASAWVSSTLYGSKYAAKSKSSGGRESIAYFDRLERQVAATTPVTTAGAVQTTAESTVVYDQWGRKTSNTRPYASTDGASVSRTTSTDSFDALNRPSLESRPDGGCTRLAYAVTGDQSIISTTSLKSASDCALAVPTATDRRTALRYTNSQGWTSKVEEILRGSPDKTLSTTYVYNAVGNLRGTTGPTGVIRSITYDIAGRKATLVDPDTGTWGYTYNGLGELVGQTDGRNASTSLSYDSLGRLLSRSDQSGVNASATSYAYDTCGKGLLCSTVATRNLNLPEVHRIEKTYSIDPRRMSPHGTVTTISDTARGVTKTFTTNVITDADGRVILTAYPDSASGNVLQVANVYTALGEIDTVKNAITNTVYWQSKGRYLDGNTYQANHGAMTVKRDFDAMARPTSIAATATTGGAAVFTGSFAFDAFGNVTSRTHSFAAAGAAANIAGQGFGYDTINRLTGTTTDEATTFTYDDAGNLLTRGRAGAQSVALAYVNNTHRPCAVASLTGTTSPAAPSCPAAAASRPYQYDGNGNVVSANRGANLPGYTASWNAANLVQQVQNTSTQARMGWEYDEGKTRVIERLYNASNALTKTTYFIGGLFEEVVEATAAGNAALATQVNYRHYVSTPDGVIGVISRSQTFSATTGLPTGNGGGINANATEKTRYWLRDHLGSVVGIADETATLTASYRFDAWGLKSTTATYLKAGESAEERGYTGHEGLDELGLGLIHMNGRLYDPTIGRFLSADPVISEPESTQGFNRYSYVGNNPLSYMDPSGFSRWTMFRDRVLKPVVAIGIGWALGPWGFMAGQGGIFGALSGFLSSTGSVAIGVSAPGVIAATQAISAVMSGFAAGGLAGGNLRSAVRGAITAGVLQGLGELISAASQGAQAASTAERLAAVSDYTQVANADGINSFGDVPIGVVSDAPSGIPVRVESVFVQGWNAYQGYMEWRDATPWFSKAIEVGSILATRGRGAAPTKGASNVTKEVLSRKSLGADGAKSSQIIERENGKMISRTHEVTKDGNVVHQHQNHTGKYGGERQFPDKWTGTKTINAPYENTPPSFPADRVPNGRNF